MIINLTPADSPYTLTPEQFTQITNLKPDVNILCSGNGSLVINLPAIADLTNGQGQLVVQLTDKVIDVTINAAAPDKFAGSPTLPFIDTSIAAIPNNNQNALFTMTANGEVWNTI